MDSTENTTDKVGSNKYVTDSTDIENHNGNETDSADHLHEDVTDSTNGGDPDSLYNNYYNDYYSNDLDYDSGSMDYDDSRDYDYNSGGAENTEMEFKQPPSKRTTEFYAMASTYMALNETEKRIVGAKFKDLVFNCTYRGADCFTQK